MNVIGPPDNLPKRVPLLTREKAAAYLLQAGFPITKSRLAKLAMTGDGPEYRIWGRRALYRADALLKWADDRASSPIQSTSQSPAPNAV